MLLYTHNKSLYILITAADALLMILFQTLFAVLLNALFIGFDIKIDKRWDDNHDISSSVS